jgi:hypothetical protein
VDAVEKQGNQVTVELRVEAHTGTGHELKPHGFPCFVTGEHVLNEYAFDGE